MIVQAQYEDAPVVNPGLKKGKEGTKMKQARLKQS
jgi:hypothetical protein